ncbi:MAG TPA: GntR family transcriptional regulator [Spirochaetia bacterium]|nr:GntR family transcriptional regulator [Spirochaetales bacterium]HRY79204.1 GntR family transcriptional regulator [Spirochaetia bacterium]
MKQISILPIRERVASEIRNAIFSGSFAPGEELGQDAIAAKLGVSRMPVREALQILAGEGLVELRVNRGAIVKDVSTESIREHFELRLILECEAAARACGRITDFSELDYIHEEQRKAIENQDVAKANMCNQALHMYIWEHSGNKKLKNILVQLWNGLSIGTVVRPIDHMRLSFGEHGEIIQAMKSRDENRARAVMAAHLKRSMENMIQRPTAEKATESPSQTA